MINPEINRIIDALIGKASCDPFIEAVYFFGSCAKGKNNACSDIDFAIVTDDVKKVDRCGLRMAVDSFDMPCDLIYTSQKKIDEVKNCLDVNFSIREEGILLWRRKS
jgi:predicted nucleotidyltransferase